MQSRPPNSQTQKLFSSQLQSILSQITKQFLSYEELYLIFYESNIKFNSQHSQAEIKQIFKEQNNMLSLRQCLSLIQLKKCEIYHNRPFFYIEVKKNGHDEKQCFQDWKILMKTKFGNQMRWFENIAGVGQARKIKSFVFKTRLKAILKGDKHQNCYESICQKFPKNTKNQIQWSTFMAVIRYQSIKYNKQQSPLESPKSRPADQITRWPETLQNVTLYRPKLSHHRYLQSQKIRRNKEKQNSSSNKNYSTAHNFYTESINYAQKDKDGINFGGNFLLKSSIQISKQFQQATQKFRNGVSQRIKETTQRAKSAKIGGTNLKKKEISQLCSAMTIKDMNANRLERSNRINTSIDIHTGTQNSQKDRKLTLSSPKEGNSLENYHRFGKYSIKVKVKQTTEPVFIDDNF